MSSHEDAVQKAREIAARLSGGDGTKRKRWGMKPHDEQPDESTKKLKPAAVTKRVWVTAVSAEKPAAHFVVNVRDDLAALEERMKKKDAEFSAAFKGKGSSKHPPLPGVPEEPLHVVITGEPSDAAQAELEIQDLLDAAEQATVDQEAIQDALVATQPLTLQQLKAYQPKSVASMIGTLPVDRLAAALLHGEQAEFNEDIKVPNGMVGFVIGRGGETIASLQAQTMCRVQIQKEFDLLPGQTDRTITLSAATKESLEECKARIEAMIQDRMREETHKNMPLGHSTVLEVRVPDADVGLIIGKGGATIKAIQEQTGANIQVPKQGDPSNPSFRTLQISHSNQAGAKQAEDRILSILNSRQGTNDTVTIHVPIPNSDVGLCIGRQGSVIQYMQHASGARIQIPPAGHPGETHRIATVTGRPDACEQVRQMVDRIIQDQSSVAVTSGVVSQAHATGWNTYQSHSGQHAGQPTTQPAAAAAVTSTDHYEPFFRYAYYYGEEAARAYYGAWSPPFGTPNPYGVNPSLAAAQAAPAAVPVQQYAAPLQQYAAASVGTAEFQASAVTNSSTSSQTAGATQDYSTQQELAETGQSTGSSLATWTNGGATIEPQPPTNDTEQQVRETGKRQVSNLPAWMMQNK